MRVISSDDYLSAAAAPRNAYVPGVMHGTSGAQNLKTPDCGYELNVPKELVNLLEGKP